MIIRERNDGSVVILDLVGSLTIEGGDEELDRYIDFVQKRVGAAEVILNFTNCKRIDSAGWGSLMRSYIVISRHGGRLVLMGISSHFERRLADMKLLTVLEIFSDEALAVDSFKSAINPTR